MILDEALKELQKDSSDINRVINNIIQEHTKDLDRLVDDINHTLKAIKENRLHEYPLKKLELDFTLLTTEIYKVNSVLTELGGTSDLAKSKREIAYSNAYMKNNGNTIKEKEALATIDTELELTLEQVYKRVITQLRLKTDNADSIHMALKRLHSARLTEMEVFRGEELKGK